MLCGVLCDWEMSKPLVLPSQDGEPWELAPCLDESVGNVEKPRGQETLSTDSPKVTTGENAVGNSDPSPRLGSADHNAAQPPRPEDPVSIGSRTRWIGGLEWIPPRFPPHRMNRGLNFMAARVVTPHQ